MRPGIIVVLFYFINNEEGWSESTREEWLEIKTLHYGRMYTRGSFDKAPVKKRADSLWSLHGGSSAAPRARSAVV